MEVDSGASRTLSRASKPYGAPYKGPPTLDPVCFDCL